MSAWWTNKREGEAATGTHDSPRRTDDAFFPVTVGGPVVVSLFTADDSLVDSLVTIVDAVDGARLKLTIIGGQSWNNPELSLSLLIADGLAAKRVRAVSYEWDNTSHGSLWVELESRFRLADERRRARVDVQLPAVLAVPDDGEHTKQLRAQIVNLSAGGARVIFDHDEATFAMRSSIFLRFCVDDELPLLVLGRIVEARRQTEHQTVLRLEFMSVTASRLARLEEYVESLLQKDLVESLINE
jgi:hypothetical protein